MHTVNNSVRLGFPFCCPLLIGLNVNPRWLCTLLYAHYTISRTVTELHLGFFTILCLSLSTFEGDLGRLGLVTVSHDCRLLLALSSHSTPIRKPPFNT